MHTEATTITPAGGADELALIRQQVEALQARIDEMEVERAGPADPAVAPPGPAPAPEPTRVGRRRAIAGLAGAAAAGTAAALASSSPAAAANGQSLVMGVGNAATNPTLLNFGGGNVSGTYGLGVVEANITGVNTRRAALFGVARGTAFASGLRAVGVGPGVDGVVGTSSEASGVVGTSSEGIGGNFSSTATDQPAVVASSTNQFGLMARGPDGAVRLWPEVPVPTTFATSKTGTLYMQGTVADDPSSQGAMWVCVKGGAPGTWRKVAAHNSAGALHILPTPKRIYDSRPGTSPTGVGPKTPLVGGDAPRTLDLKQNSSGVPAGATGAVVTVLLVNAAIGDGNFTIWANDKLKPPANTLVWGGSAKRFTTQTITAVDAQARVKVDASRQTDVVIDVVGFYR
ncbi:MAG TPA: hypothetical protein VK507_24010 [Iamia sp.]|nr:hypothetical protein [Iamia sp.]